MGETRSGPLTGLRVVELAGLGPGPVRRHAARRPRRRRGTRRPAGRRHRLRRVRARPAHPRPPLGRGRPQAAGGCGRGARPGRTGRRADRGVPPGRRRAAGRRAGRLPRPQPPAGLRPDDRLGPGRAAAPAPPGTTSATSRSPVPCTRSAMREVRRRCRSTWWATSAVARCTSSPACSPRCSRRAAAARARWSTRRSSTAPATSRPWCAAWSGPAPGRTAAASTCSTVARRSTRCYETADHRHLAIGPLEPQFYAELLDRLGLADDDLPAQYDVDGWPRLRAAIADRIASRPARGVAADVRGQRCLRGTGAVTRGVAAAPAARGARHVRRARRDGPARSRAAILPHAGDAVRRHRPDPASTPERPCRTGGSPTSTGCSPTASYEGRTSAAHHLRRRSRRRSATPCGASAPSTSCRTTPSGRRRGSFRASSGRPPDPKACWDSWCRRSTAAEACATSATTPCSPRSSPGSAPAASGSASTTTSTRRT